MENLVTEEIEKLTRTLYMPESQKYVRAGFKKIAHSEIEDRFAIPAINARLEKERTADIVKRAGLRWWNWYSRGEIKEYQFLNQITVYFNSLFVPIIGWGGSLCKAQLPWIPHLLAEVKYDHLDNYAGDVIPDYCLEAIQKFTELGGKVAQLYVAYPVVGEVKRPDPILVWIRNAYPHIKSLPVGNPSGYDMIEIACWE